MMNPLKSITEMRNRGESRRLLDEVGYLWEGLDPSAGIGLRRSSALEINTKLCDSDFARKAKTADFIGQTWEFLLEANREEDKVMNILLAFFCALVARDPGSLVELVQRDSSQVVQTLFALLASFPPKSDPLHLVSDANQLRKLGLSKKEQNLAASIHSMLRSSALFPPFTPLSTALLVSHTLASLPSASLKPTPANLKAILDNLREHFSSFSPSLSAFVTISQHSEKQNALAHLHNLLSLFDSYLLRGWALQAEGDININQQQLEAARTDWFADGLTSFAILTEVISSRSATSEVEQGKARQCTLVTLRLLVGLTHADKIWCGKVASREECLLFIMRTILRGHVDHMEKVKKHQSSKIKTEPSSSDDFPRLDNSYQEPTMPKDDGLDALCLALGLLTNLVQLEDEVKTTIRDITSSTRCRPTKCLEKCLCPNRISAPRALVEMYTDLVLTSSAPVKQEPCLDSGQQTDLLAAGETRLLLSHLSLLFGLLMKDNSTNQRDILDWLPESPTSLACDGQSGKVQMLIAHAKEFSYLYAESGDEGGSARDVIVFLEQLQNQL
ncbi:hypothetical protein MIND_00321200 [Mycena indigotica]|uniref:Wings apart-like protein C-terminal domain-containing protein n=1 Tax=Mycena indigotica TaxID=2126181 RepID=A0A8H6WEI4_9AGAR|nr:uncharacterized protein MIND_00321200 [Mycena indigotica]KAF7309504.1 hypothetical protein MIND_00321200 [Mycena indigotica]